MNTLLALLFLMPVIFAGDVDTSEEGDVIDLTHRLDDQVLGYPTYPNAYNFSNFFNGSVLNNVVWAEANQISMIIHTGTHVDAPCHFDPKAWRLQDVPFHHFIGPAVVIDITKQCNVNPNYEMTVQDIKNWEEEHGSIPEGAIVLLSTGGEKYWGNMTAYFGTDQVDPTKFQFPGIELASGQYFLDKKIKGIGMDWGVIDSADSTRLNGTDVYRVHQLLLPNNVLIYEYVKNVVKLPPTGYTIYALPLRIWNACGSPIRMIAIKNPVSSAIQNSAHFLLMLATLFALYLKEY